MQSASRVPPRPKRASPRRRALALALALALGMHSNALVAGPLRIVGTEAPPFMSWSGDKAAGFCVDVVREIQRRVADSTPIELLPWPRVLAIANASADILVPCAKRTASRESHFIWLGSVFISKTYVYVPFNSPLRANTVDEVKALPSILAPRGSYAHEMLSALGFKNVTPVNTGLTALKMVMLGRASGFVSEPEALDALLNQAELPRDALRPLTLAFDSDSYLAFSMGTSEARSRPWQEALSAMKVDGTFERLYRAWFKAAPSAKLISPADPH